MGLFDKPKRYEQLSPEERRAKNNAYIKKAGIACYDDLPVISSASEVTLRDKDTMCSRAVACLLSIQLACDLKNGYDFEESASLYSAIIRKYGSWEALIDVEKRLFNKEYSGQDIVNVIWSYECYWTLVWALGLVSDREMKFPNKLCNCKKAIALVSKCKDLEHFESKTKPRSTDEVLDMLDLYYRYQWACVHKSLKPGVSIGGLNPAVVIERRRGLEWLVSDVADWNEIQLNT